MEYAVGMKALILAGGAGTRLRPITDTQSKQLIPVANKPILFYGLEAVAAAGIREVGMIVGHTEEEIRGAVGDGSRWGVEVTYLPQEAPLGLAHAVLTGQEFLGEEDFVMYLGDNVVPEGITGFVRAYEENKPDAQIFLVKVPEPERFGVAVLEGERVVRLVEKPKEPLSDLALAGIYIFNASIFRAAAAIEPSWRGELEITDAIQYLVEHGYNVRAEMITGWWKDTGKPEDLLEANRILLDGLGRRIDGAVDESSHVVGEVAIEEGAQVRDSVIRGPSIIGRNVTVTGSILGPYVSVSEDAIIEDSEIDDSVLMSGSVVREVRRVSQSLIGRDVTIAKDKSQPAVYRFTTGAGSVIRTP
jgi:glucose-1-phosphate thymidylyltransferase